MSMWTRTAVFPATGRKWELAENATMRLPSGRVPTVVRVERGTVLVTQAGDLEDHVLESGDEIVLAVGGLAVAWAFTEATVSVSLALTGSRARAPAPVAASSAA
jgi:hypothetical protein